MAVGYEAFPFCDPSLEIYAEERSDPTDKHLPSATLRVISCDPSEPPPVFPSNTHLALNSLECYLPSDSRALGTVGV